MIFRRFLSRLAQHQWGAIATEIVIVIIGVFIGIQVSNWNEDRETRRKADVFTARLVDDLRKEAWGYAYVIQYNRETNANQRRVLDAMAGHAALSDEQFMISAYRATQYIYNVRFRATYDELVSTGNIGLIADERLRGTAIGIFTTPLLDQVMQATRDRNTANCLGNRPCRGPGGTVGTLRRSLCDGARLRFDQGRDRLPVHAWPARRRDSRGSGGLEGPAQVRARTPDPVRRQPDGIDRLAGRKPLRVGEPARDRGWTPMILRRLAKDLKQQNWAAIGIELVIVVVGVFLGIQVSNWNGVRADRVAHEAARDEGRAPMSLLAEPGRRKAFKVAP